MRVFFDANILFSAAKSNGAVRALLLRLFADGQECWVDAYVVEEARRNLEAKGVEAIDYFDRLLPRLHMEPASLPAAAFAELHWLDERDRPVLAAATRLRCDALVTGDRTHFGAANGNTFGGVAIHSPRSLAEAIGMP